MTHLHVSKARTDIYREGKRVEKVHGKGKNAGNTYITVDRTQPADAKDEILVHKGDTYYWWQFQFGPKHLSATRPRRSALTQSAHLGAIWDIEDDLAALTEADVDDGFLDPFISEIESEREACEEALENMPEGLRESSASGETLQQYIEALQEWQEELEGVDMEIDDDSLRAEAAEECEEEFEGHDHEADGKPETVEQCTDRLVEEKLTERRAEILAEVQGITCNI